MTRCIGLPRICGSLNPKRAIEALDLKRRYGTLWPEDYLELADLQFGQKNFVAATTAIAQAIDEAPERADLCEKQKDIDRAAGFDEPAAQARAAQCLRQGAETAARLGRSALAVKLYLQALSAADAPATRSGDDVFAEQSAARSLSAFLSRQFGVPPAPSGMRWRRSHRRCRPQPSGKGRESAASRQSRYFISPQAVVQAARPPRYQ